MLRPPDPGTFEQLLTLVPVPVAGMVRLSISGRTEPFWSRSARYRFDDPSAGPASARYGTLYVAPELCTAFAESVIHENALFRNGVFEVPLSEIDGRELTWFGHDTRSEMQVVDLTGAAAKRMGLNNDISAGDDYRLPQRWAKAIHDARPEADGLKYQSRQRPGEVCYAIFDRSGLKASRWRSLTDDEKIELCDLFNVVPV